MISQITTGSTNGDVVVAVAVAGMLTPFLNWVLGLTRAKVDKDNVIVTGASSSVSAMGEALDRLRKELNEVSEDLTECRKELDGQAGEHRAQIAQIRAEHRQEVASLNMAHRAQMAELRAQRDDLRATLRRMASEET